MSRSLQAAALDRKIRLLNNNISNIADDAGSLIEPGPFPLHAMNETMRAIVEETAEVHQIPVELPAIAAIATFSGALGTSREVTGAVNNRKCFGNVYMIVAAPKSTGKGATAAIIAPVISASREMMTDFAHNTWPKLKVEKKELERGSKSLLDKLAKPKTLQTSKEAIRNELERNQRRIDEIDPLLVGEPSYWISNATSEAMAIQFARNNSALFAYSPEAGEAIRVMLGKYNDKGKGDFDLYLSGYSVEPIRINRVNRPPIDISPCLSLLFFCQPTVLREVITNEEAFERGLTARILPVIIEPDLKEDDGQNREIKEETTNRWDSLIRSILSLRGPPDRPNETKPIICSPEAREVFRAFHNESIRLRNGEYKDIEGELGRWRENAIRLTIGQCIADDLSAISISEDQAKRGVKIAHWFARSALKIMNAGRMEQKIARQNKLVSILAEYGGSQTLRDLERRHGFSHDEVKRLADVFPERLRVTENRETGGRPSEHVSIIKHPR